MAHEMQLFDLRKWKLSEKNIAQSTCLYSQHLEEAEAGGLLVCGMASWLSPMQPTEVPALLGSETAPGWAPALPFCGQES